ncbi:MAG: hypothetical protein HKN77_06715 [Woeseiaceae bacterium]|nr:hypothetical protein [Woeseiaceae bacterium]
MSISAASVGLAVDVDVLPLSVRIHAASVDTVAMVLDAADPADDEPAPGTDEVLNRLRLPFWLLVDDLTLRDARLGGTAMAQELLINRAYFRGQWYDRIYIDELSVETPYDQVQVSGRVQLAEPFAVDAQADIATTQSFVGDDDFVQLHLVVSGNIDELEFSGQGVTRLTGYRPLNVGVGGSANAGGLRLDSITMTGEDLGLSGDADLQWQDGLTLSLNAAIERANVNAVADTWPAANPLQGNVSLVFQPGVVRISNTRLAVVGTDANVDLTADIDIATRDVAGSVKWGQVKWPVAAASPDVASRAGNVRVTGTLDSWRIQGEINVEAAEIKEGKFIVDGAGDRERAQVSISEANIFGGTLSGAASYAWVDRQAWSASLDVLGIKTAAFAAAWPGVISGRINASGRRLDSFLEAEVSNLRGTVRDRQFVANGGLQVDGKDFTARKLSLQHGTSDIIVDGNLYGEKGVSFVAIIGNLGELVPGAKGAIDAKGAVSLRTASPFLRLDASSDVLTYGDLHISNLRIVDRGDDAGLWHARISADDLSMGGELILEPELLVDATTTGQTFSLSGGYREFMTRLQLVGAFDRWDAPKRWDGELRELEFGGGGATRVSLNEAVGISFSADHVQLQRACFSATTDTHGCAGVDWQFSERISLAADISRIPLNVVNSFRDTGFTFDQEITGNILWRQATGQRATGAGDISISPGKIVSRDRPTFVVDTDTGTIRFDIDNGRLLSANLQLPMPGTGHIDGQFSVMDLTDTATSAVNGELKFELQDIAVISVLSPLVDTASGRLQANLDVAGTAQSPLFSGELLLQKGSISYLPLGLHLEDVDLTSQLEQNRRLNIAGNFRAGEGRGEIISSAEYDGSAATGLQLQVRGRDLTVIDVPDVFARADIDLRIGYLNDLLTVDGKVLVPHARVHPKDLASSRATVSEDVMIVAGELPYQEEAETESKLTMGGAVDVVLGSDVVVDLDLAKATVTGSTTFDWRGPTMPMANGRFSIAGDIQAYGQVLKIVEGVVRFPNVSADNPFLRIRAEREIYGNSQIRTAGVLVDGTLARPTLEAYTLPATSEERALTLLVTGSDFNFEAGVGAVDFGTYVAPKLFVSYGVGLFGRDNVISARYDLARGFGIKATSGQTESGIDIIYRFER